jgi:class 3 adenylate cyclase
MDLRVSPQTDHAPTRPGGDRAARDAELGAEPYALLGIELRRVPRPNSKIVGDIEEVVLNRCVLAAVEVLTAGGAEIEVAGTPKRPVVEARFAGEEAAAGAARAAVRVLAAVRQVQRAAENEFQVSGALTVGMAAEGPGGARVVSGGADLMQARLRERAAPGQILLSDEARGATRDVVEATPARRSVAGPEGDEAPTYILRGPR